VPSGSVEELQSNPPEGCFRQLNVIFTRCSSASRSAQEPLVDIGRQRLEHPADLVPVFLAHGVEVDLVPVQHRLVE
jgi:hypothetical protein